MKAEINRHELNTPGRYYVDCDICLHHECCVETAPNNFRLHDEVLTAYVFKQPDNAVEESQCREALEECPMAAIQVR
jgi:ferredoxin